MEFMLKSKKTDSGILILHIPLMLRLSIVAIGIIIFLASFIPLLEGSQAQLGVSSVILLIILLFGALYEERWIFDPKNKLISFHFGLILLSKKMHIQFSQVSEISIEKSVRGKAQLPAEEKEPARQQSWFGNLFRPKVFINLVLYLNDAERLIIESGNPRKEERLIDIKNQIEELINSST